MSGKSNQRYGYPVARWEKAKIELTDILVIHAQNASGNPPTYSDIAGQLTEIKFAPDELGFHHMLGEISESEEKEGRGMLSAVVVTPETGRPAADFFDLAVYLGRKVSPDDAASRELFWNNEINRIRKTSAPQRHRRSVNWR